MIFPQVVTISVDDSGLHDTMGGMGATIRRWEAVATRLRSVLVVAALVGLVYRVASRLRE